MKVVPAFPPERYAQAGAVGLLVPGHGATVTRRAALEALRGATGAGETTIVALPPGGASHNVRRYGIAVLGGGFHGLLLSRSTRVPGLVAIGDLKDGGALHARADAHAPGTLRRLDRRLTQAHGARGWATVALVLVSLALLAAGRPRAALLSVPAALLAALVLSAGGGGRPWIVVPTLAAATLAGALTLERLPVRPVLLAFLLVYLVVLAGWPETSSLAAIGPHPDGGGRFYGVTNAVETLLLAPVLAAASLAFAPAAVLALVLVGWSKAGADGGGILVFAVALGVLWLRRRAIALTSRRAVLLASGAVALGLALVGLDAALGGSSHVTHAVGSGPGSLAGDFAHRLRVSWEGATRSGGAVAAVLAGLVVLAAALKRRDRPAAVDALLAGIAVSLIVNDSPTDVLGFGALVCALLWAWERARSVHSAPE